MTTAQRPRDPYRFQPIFLLCPARSCSSVAIAMLGQHPQLYGFPELRLFRAAKVGGLLISPEPSKGMPSRERNSGLVRTIAQLHDGTQSYESAERAWRWLCCRRELDVQELLDHLLTLVAPRTAIEKSPETSLTCEALDRAARAYPAARYIHLVRHPWTTVASMATAWGRLSYWSVPPAEAAEYCARVWLSQHRRIDAFGSRMGTDRFVRVRAEDLINRPEHVIPQLCGRLGISQNDHCTRPMSSPEMSVFASRGPANASGGLDPKFLDRPHRHHVLLPSSLDPQPIWSVDGPTRKAVTCLAREFGYEDPGASWRSSALERGSIVPQAPPEML